MRNLISSPFNYECISEDISQAINEKIEEKQEQDNFDAFYVGDMGDIVRKFKIWKALLPRVEPFYAVKCNDDPEILKVLSQLGTGFDCASKGEISKVMDLGVDPRRIIYANPCKQASHIKYASKKKVHYMTFDNETELHKVKEHHPNAKMVVRILPPSNDKCQCNLGMKFGCQTKQVPHLLRVAKSLDVEVVGVSFHVGSGCYDPQAYNAAIKSAKRVFQMAAAENFCFWLLDIGGGFPGQPNAKLSFNEIVDVLRPSLDEYFPEGCGVKLIAEPGRFFVASAFTLTVSVIASRKLGGAQDVENYQEEEEEEDGEEKYMYYVNDGVYGSFNCLLFDHATVEPELPVLPKYMGQEGFKSSLWGPTCDGLDCISKECQLPKLDTGDWIIFRDMGAYTMTAASCFNGMPKPNCFYLMNQTYMDVLMNGVGHNTGSILPEESPVMEEQQETSSANLCPLVMRSGLDRVLSVVPFIESTPQPYEI